MPSGKGDRVKTSKSDSVSEALNLQGPSCLSGPAHLLQFPIFGNTRRIRLFFFFTQATELWAPVWASVLKARSSRGYCWHSKRAVEKKLTNTSDACESWEFWLRIWYCTAYLNWKQAEWEVVSLEPGSFPSEKRRWGGIDIAWVTEIMDFLSLIWLEKSYTLCEGHDDDGDVDAQWGKVWQLRH